MFKTQIVRQVARAANRSTSVLSSKTARLPTRPISTTSVLRASDKDLDDATTSAPPGASGDHEGQHARTDDRFRFDHPGEGNMPPTSPVRGRGGVHNLPTLATFSLNDRVVALTGGARGLGLVMAQACIISGADVAIIDLNSELYSFRPVTSPMLTVLQRKKQQGKRRC